MRWTDVLFCVVLYVLSYRGLRAKGTGEWVSGGVPQREERWGEEEKEQREGTEMDEQNKRKQKDKKTKRAPTLFMIPASTFSSIPSLTPRFIASDVPIIEMPRARLLHSLALDGDGKGRSELQTRNSERSTQPGAAQSIEHTATISN